MIHALKSLPYEGYTTKVTAHYFMITKRVFQPKHGRFEMIIQKQTKNN